ncbi:hypothetical protein F8M41_000528 [Gigaspora margarita]|uniref:Uncharacterized protein n=1 Tax=Gigaspora margarita TaxID=4874 RepID=A0A8H3XGI6_GIGMA|nr:hypothetical protein F8M41_000528 [Gigaspora margarita]
MDNETTICTCPRCLQKNPLGVSMTKKVASNHQRAFLWVQQLEEQIDDSYVNFNTRHLKKKKKRELNNDNLNLINIEENKFNEENYDYQYEEYSDFIETTQLSPNLSQNSSIYTNNNSSENSFNSQDNINDLYQNFVMEEYTNDILLETNEG